MSRVNIKSASSGLYPHTYNFSSIGSIDLGELVTDAVVETVPTDQWNNFHSDGILRLAPQVFPPYGKLFLKHASFFVPEHQLIEYADALRENMDTFKGHSIRYPFFYADHINFIFSTYSPWGTFSTEVTTRTNPEINPPAKNTFDFIYLTGNSTANMSFSYCKLNALGKRLYKILKCLGYDFASYSFDSSSYSYDGVSASAHTKVNALKLLAYAKVYNDYFANAQTYNYTNMTALLHDIRNNQTHTDSNGNPEYDASTGQLYQRAIIQILKVTVPHEQNMYTEAWNSPNSPLGTNQSFQSINPVGSVSPFIPPTLNPNNNTSFPNGIVNDNESSGLFSVSNSSTFTALQNISSFGLKMLEAWDRFVRRFNISGSKVVEKVYARFGIEPDDKNSHYARKIYESAYRIPFYPVMSNSDTVPSAGSSVGKSLGSYSGMGGLQTINIDFNYNCNDYGFIIVVSWLNIIPIQVRGFDPSVLRLNAFDYWTPEYDGKAMRAIPNMEISVDRSCGPESANKADTQIFGFTNIYDDYRELRDNVFGDFVTDENVRNFLFARDLSVIRESSNVMYPQTAVVQYYDVLASDNPDLTNPFQMSADNGNRFYLELDWTINAMRPILPKAEALDLGGSGPVSVPINGQMMQ